MNCLINSGNTFERTWLSIGPFWAAGYCVAKGIENLQGCLVSESSVTLLKIAALQFPIAGAISVVTGKILDSFEWQPSENRSFAIRTFSSISTMLLMPIVAVRFGLTTSSDIGLMVPLITAQFMLGAACVVMGVKNVLFNDNQRPPVLRF